MQSINPATGQLIHSYNIHSSKEIKHIVDQCALTQKKWRHEMFYDRSVLMKQAAAFLRDKKNDFAQLITKEMGKILRESLAEVEKCAWVCDYYAEHAQNFLEDEIIETEASKSFVTFEPLGLVLAVMPWNFPFWQVFRFAAPAIMAGNGGLLKHASNVSGCALAIEEVFKKAGFPADLFRTLMIPSAMVSEVIENDHIKAVTLTGSEPAGSAVASIAGKSLKKTVLELGGSDPYIVLEDADLPACVKVSAQARMLNVGQSCIAAKRFIVVQSVLQEFEMMQTEIMKNMVVGDPLKEETDVGPLARPDLVDDLDRQVKESIEQGARILYGGNKINGQGSFYEPTVLTDVKPGMAVYHEETFGPVSAIIPVENEQEAIMVANDSEFGLGGSIWSKNIERAEKIARQIETGGVFINGMTKSDPRLPFGGIKKSGYGRELSHYGIKEFVNMKTIWIK